MQNITLSLVLIIVCMPEGLPVTVDLSLAHSTKHMDTQENILVRNLDAPEMMGKVTEICTGLTGTLTESEFSVGRLFAQQRMIKNSRRDTLTHCQLTDPVVDLIVESIMWNSDCHMELTPEAMYAPKGNDTECAFLKWLQDAEVDVHKHCLTRQHNECARIPFDSVVKRSIVAVNHPFMNDTVRVYIKGAPEVVLATCTAEFSDSGDKTPIEEARVD
jgi:magnesium-transporting ATPase (P-type)